MKANQKGFTFVETILYLAIMGAIMTTIALFLIQVMNARAKTRAISAVIASAHLVQERLSEAVRHAQSINVANSVFAADPGVLSLQMVDVARDPIVFSLTADDGQFQVSQAGEGPVPLTPQNIKVKNLVFTNLTSPQDVGIIRIQFTLETSSASGSKPYFYDQAFQTTLRIPLD